MPQCKTIYIYGVTPCYIKQVTFSFPWIHDTNLHGLMFSGGIERDQWYEMS